MRALAAFAKDRGSVSSTHTVVLVLGNLIPSSGLHGHYMQVVYTHIGRHMLRHINKKKYTLKNKLLKKVFAMVAAEVAKKGAVEETWGVDQQAGLS